MASGPAWLLHLLVVRRWDVRCELTVFENHRGKCRLTPPEGVLNSFHGVDQFNAQVLIMTLPGVKD